METEDAQPIRYGPGTPLPPGDLAAVPDMDRDISYYLSGPMAGYPDHNWPEFTEAAAILRRTGLRIVSPTEINPAAKAYAEAHPGEYNLRFLKNDLWAELSCDGLILLRGWPRSRGARLELDLALDLEYPVYFYNNYRLVAMQ